jgi:excisionase family DNA binding protein
MTERVNVDDLPPTIDLLTAAGLLGVGRTAAYRLVREGRWPTPVVRAGRLIRVPTAPLLAAIGLSTDPRDLRTQPTK